MELLLDDCFVLGQTTSIKEFRHFAPLSEDIRRMPPDRNFRPMAGMQIARNANAISRTKHIGIFFINASAFLQALPLKGRRSCIGRKFVYVVHVAQGLQQLRMNFSHALPQKNSLLKIFCRDAFQPAEVRASMPTSPRIFVCTT
jgi:hypothetical protein